MFLMKRRPLGSTVILTLFHYTTLFRSGPVLVDINKDVTANIAEFTKITPQEITKTAQYCEQEIEKVVEMIAKSQKPYIFVGGGAILSGASKQVRELAQKIDAPVCDSLLGKGAFDGNDPLYTGMIGMHRSEERRVGKEC